MKYLEALHKIVLISRDALRLYREYKKPGDKKADDEEG